MNGKTFFWCGKRMEKTTEINAYNYHLVKRHSLCEMERAMDAAYILFYDSIDFWKLSYPVSTYEIFIEKFTHTHINVYDNKRELIGF